MTIEEMEVLIIHRCKSPNYKGVKITDRLLLPKKCSDNLCRYYAIWYGTCVKTGDKCLACGDKLKGNLKIKPSSIFKGDLIIFRNAKGQKVEMIVLEEDKLKVLVLELINGQERTIPINRAGYIKRRCDARRLLREKV